MEVINGGFRPEDKPDTPLSELLEACMEHSGLGEETDVKFVLVVDTGVGCTFMSNEEETPNVLMMFEMCKHVIMNATLGGEI